MEGKGQFYDPESDVIVPQKDIAVPGRSRRNLPVPRLVEIALARREGMLASNGAFVAYTAPRTGRSPKDKFVVQQGDSAKEIWWGPNAPIEPRKFDQVFQKVADYVANREMFVFNGYAGADPKHRLRVRIKTEFAWHSLFVRQLFIRPGANSEQLEHMEPDYRVICVPNFHADPDHDATNSTAFIMLNFEKKLVLIGGTRYAGEMKKSIFTVMNYCMPKQGVLPMHCSANVGEDGDVALFFGLSGTGKTTLSADPNRRLIGDDEHGWGDNGVFNFEGGCYAKCINLTREKEPQIWDAIRFGSVLENVVLNDDRTPDYFDSSITENTRCAYPVEFIDNALIPGVAGHPNKVIFLTADATGVLPPVARLTAEQAMYHFLSGYTSKLAGTETGITKPTAVFSTCFGQPFLPLPASVYAEMLGEKLRKHNATPYLINTGWIGGPYGVGERINLPYTRAIITAVLRGQLDKAEMIPDPVFGILVPKAVEGVPSDILQPRTSWKDKEAYDSAARALAEDFRKNFTRFAGVADVVKQNGGPRV